MEQTIAELRAALAAAEAIEADKAKAIAQATPPAWKFTVEPTTTKQYDEVYDDTCVLYQIKGEVTNIAEAKAAGHHHLSGGAMQYVYNTVIKKIIMATGGGTIYIGRGWNDKNGTSHIEAMQQVSDFIAANPEGGDITAIVEAHRKRTGFNC